MVIHIARWYITRHVEKPKRKNDLLKRETKKKGVKKKWIKKEWIWIQPGGSIKRTEPIGQKEPEFSEIGSSAGSYPRVKIDREKCGSCRRIVNWFGTGGISDQKTVLKDP